MIRCALHASRDCGICDKKLGQCGYGGCYKRGTVRVAYYRLDDRNVIQEAMMMCDHDAKIAVDMGKHGGIRAEIV